MTSVHKIIAAAIPGADDDVVDFIMWARTPYPCGAVSPRKIYKAASGWHRACNNKCRLCDFCDNLARPDYWLCQRCDEALHPGRVS